MGVRAQPLHRVENLELIPQSASMVPQLHIQTMVTESKLDLMAMKQAS